MNHKLNLKNFHKPNIKEWSVLKWFWIISWLLAGILLIILIVLLVVYQGNKGPLIENTIAGIAFAFLVFLILAIFSQVIDIYLKKKSKNFSGKGLK